MQEQVKSQFVRSESKEFAFTRLMTCGLCGSGITADEKFKKLKGGGVNRHVYYGCTKVRDRNCKCGYINETELLRQFEGIIETIDVDEIGIKEKIKDEVTRFKKFQQSLLGKQDKIIVDDIDVRNYAKYILREGRDIEKREFLSCLKGVIKLSDKKIHLTQ